MTIKELVHFYEVDPFNVEGSVVRTETLPALRKLEKIEEIINQWCDDKTWETDTSYLYEILDVLEEDESQSDCQVWNKCKVRQCEDCEYREYWRKNE